MCSAPPQNSSAGCPSNPLYPSAGATAVTVQNCSTLISNLASKGQAALVGNSSQIWTSNGSTGGSSVIYTYQDYRGYCLEANDAYGLVYPSGTPGSGASFTMLQVAACDGNLTQKWNAPPNYGASNVANTYES
ncbi:MAG: hypothetical protein ACP5P1_10610 [Acidimicrobiales bacterium]